MDFLKALQGLKDGKAEGIRPNTNNSYLVIREGSLKWVDLPKSGKVDANNNPYIGVRPDQYLEEDWTYVNPSIEENKWYQHPAGGYWYIQKAEDNTIYIYGFDSSMRWIKPNSRREKIKGLIEISTYKMNEHILKEAEKRGFSDNMYYKNTEGEKRYANHKPKVFYVYNNSPMISCGDGQGLIFNEGVWGQVLKTISKREAEEKLDVVIKD